MKRILLILFISITALNIRAQENATASSKANDRLPVAGDIAFGIDALPYLNYLGNIFNNTVNNTLVLGSNNIYVRYFLADDFAVRAIISISDNINKSRTYVRDDAAYFVNPLSQDKVIDEQRTHNQSYGLAVGLMKTRGYEKLRGFYGAQIRYAYGRNSVSYSYGNEMTPANPAPSSIWGNVTERALETDNGINQALSGGIFLGVEYYFLPKVCIGGEASLMLTYNWGSQGNTKSELIQNGARFERDQPLTPGNRSFNLSTFRPATYGGLYLMFHF
ncbi:MAG: hypothetical protein N2662_03400 [Bacteroidales bacterium]|nr:hypothetical protein [Bacteroidales bacterium]